MPNEAWCLPAVLQGLGCQDLIRWFALTALLFVFMPSHDIGNLIYCSGLADQNKAVGNGVQLAGSYRSRKIMFLFTCWWLVGNVGKYYTGMT